MGTVGLCQLRASTDRQSVTSSETVNQSAGMVAKGKKTKNPPILSHEFVIQNHADIVACVAMVFVVGLMFQVSSPLASVFIALSHNVSLPVEVQPGAFQDLTFYTPGWKDVPAVFFYLLIAVVMHAIIQEYLLDKVNRKLHLSKIKHAKFDESGQLFSLYLAFIVPAYVMRFTRVCIVLLFIHYLVEAVYHGCRILAYAEKSNIAKKVFKLGDFPFVMVRFASVILS